MTYDEKVAAVTAAIEDEQTKRPRAFTTESGWVYPKTMALFVLDVLAYHEGIEESGNKAPPGGGD